MNKPNIVLIRFAALFLLSGCSFLGIEGNGVEKTLEPVTEPFTGLSVSEGARITLIRGDVCRAVVKIDENLASSLEVGVCGGILSVGFDGGMYCPTVYEVEITAPRLERISLSGGCRAKGSLRGEGQLTVSLSGGSTLCGTLDDGDIRCLDTESPDTDNPDVEVPELEDPAVEEPVVEEPVIEVPVVEEPANEEPLDLVLNLSGGSCTCFKGAIRNLDLSLSGGSRARLGGLSCRDVRYSLSGGSDAEIQAEGSVAGSLSGGSTLSRY
jgi:hypothetical protein